MKASRNSFNYRNRRENLNFIKNPFCMGLWTHYSLSHISLKTNFNKSLSAFTIFFEKFGDGCMLFLIFSKIHVWIKSEKRLDIGYILTKPLIGMLQWKRKKTTVLKAILIYPFVFLQMELRDLRCLKCKIRHSHVTKVHQATQIPVMIPIVVNPLSLGEEEMLISGESQGVVQLLPNRYALT